MHPPTAQIVHLLGQPFYRGEAGFVKEEEGQAEPVQELQQEVNNDSGWIVADATLAILYAGDGVNSLAVVRQTGTTQGNTRVSVALASALITPFACSLFVAAVLARALQKVNARIVSARIAPKVGFGHEHGATKGAVGSCGTNLAHVTIADIATEQCTSLEAVETR